jgi:AcrR family transcriptional regulator
MAPVANPKQARSRRTLERIVAAGLQLLEEGGPDAVTVQAVVRRARSSVGSFYARFQGKDDLLEHLREQVRSSTEAEWKGAVAAEAWDSSLARAAARAVALILERRPRYDARLRTADGPASAREHEDLRRKALDELAARLLERRDEITHPDPERAVRIGLAAVLGVAEHAPAKNENGGADVIRAECTQLLLGYLSGRAHDADNVDFFDVWD